MAETLQTYMNPNMTETIIQALKSLEDIFEEAADAKKFANIKLTSSPSDSTKNAAEISTSKGVANTKQANSRQDRMTSKC